MSKYIEVEALYELARTSPSHKDFGRSQADLTSLRELCEEAPAILLPADVCAEEIHAYITAMRDGRVIILNKHIIPDGAEAWIIDAGKVIHGTVSHHTDPYRMYFLSDSKNMGTPFANSSVGEYVFLTEAEALSALEAKKK